MMYNDEIFRKYKNMSIKDAADLIPGTTYYSNWPPYEFTLVSLHTHAEKHEAEGRPFTLSEMDAASQELTWMLVSVGDASIYRSLADDNIGDSYNPWLIFKDAETAAACRQELVVTFPQTHDDYFIGTTIIIGKTANMYYWKDGEYGEGRV